MTKQDLVNSMAAKAGVSKVAAAAALKAFTDAVTSALKKGDSVTITNFGTFNVRKQKARERVIPRTKTKKMFPAKNVAKFKPGKELKEAVK